MSDKEFPSCAYDVCAEFDCEETMALALIATRNELERTRKALEVAQKENEDKQAVLNCVVDMLKTLNQKYTLIMGKDVIKETVRLLEQKDVK